MQLIVTNHKVLLTKLEDLLLLIEPNLLDLIEYISFTSGKKIKCALLLDGENT